MRISQTLAAGILQRAGEADEPPSSASSASNGNTGLHRLLMSCATDYADEVVRGLISTFESPSAPVETQLHTAMMLHILAKHNPENRLKIASTDTVRPFVTLLFHPDLQLQEHGVTAILKLCLCDENKDPIATDGAIHPLIRALKTGTSAACENAAIALLHLSEEEGPHGKKDALTATYPLRSTPVHFASLSSGGNLVILKIWNFYAPRA
uniref:U-box domain-containing protein 13-like n=1 Tax=Elaeis guineensis var. tenera TaxID=51953 RepID=A0A6J0PLT1_ELAGV|nr:U-box domain-containing protein 13-like [Elaeis guineensis]